MDSSALPEVMMGSTFTLCTAAPPFPLCLESALHPTGAACSGPAVTTDARELGSSQARPRWRASSPLCPAHVGLVHTLHPPGSPRAHGCNPGVTDTGFTHPLRPSGQAGRQGHIHTPEAGTGAWLCHGIVPALLCSRTLGQKAGWLGCCLGSRLLVEIAAAGV